MEQSVRERLVNTLKNGIVFLNSLYQEMIIRFTVTVKAAESLNLEQVSYILAGDEYSQSFSFSILIKLRRYIDEQTKNRAG